MSISRNTFDPEKNFKQVSYHQDRDLLDSELNEQQQIAVHERSKLFNRVFNEGAILSGFTVQKAGHVLDVGPGVTYIQGHVEAVAGASLTYDPAKDHGADYVFVELLRYTVNYNTDSTLINPATGEPTAERVRWVLALTNENRTGQALPNNVSSRHVVPIYKFDRATDEVTPAVKFKSPMAIEDLVGTIPGDRIRVSSISESQLNFAAAEGRGSLLQNIAERTNDQAGSYLVDGFESNVGATNPDDVTVTTDAGRAYVTGFRLQKDLPTETLVPVSRATKSVRGEQKTFVSGRRRYPVNSTPLRGTTQVEAIVEITSNVTRGSVGGGEDLLTPNPVVTILEVSQGATVFEVGTDWNPSGNYVDWTGTGREPGLGTTYTVRWTYTQQMTRGVDYADGSWFGVDGHPETGTYHYLMTAFDASGETGFDAAGVVTIDVGSGDVIALTWRPVVSAIGYRVYRGQGEVVAANFRLLAEVTPAATLYEDDGVDQVTEVEPPSVASTPLRMSAIQAAPGNRNVVNFGRTNLGLQPVPGSNCSVDYDYFLGRIDTIYATAGEIKRLEGPSADFPKPPVLPEGALGLCSVFCPPNSTALAIDNHGLRRVTMDQIHQLIQDVEALKYNDARSQMNASLAHRDGASKKGIYSDDFSNDVQSDVFHPEWSARIDTDNQFVTVGRAVSPHLLEVDHANSNMLFSASLAMLPATEVLLAEQNDWSETKNINPYAVYEAPTPSIEVQPNMGRQGQTGIAVTCSNFSPSQTLTATCDGIEVSSDVTTDQYGRAVVSFTIPATARLGERSVSVSDDTRTASGSLVINDPLVVTRIERVVVNRTIIRERTTTTQGQAEAPTPEPRIIRRNALGFVWTESVRDARRDPLAQTFSFGRSHVVNAIGVYFAEKDDEIPVTVQIRGVTVGLPNDKVLAEKVIAPSEITTNQQTRVVFADPFLARANTSYAVVLLTNSNAYRVQIATLGQMGQNGLITSQPYNTGVLLESSNAETWTPLNGSDLRVRIYGYHFQSTGFLQFHPVSGVSLSEFNIDEYSSIPETSRISWAQSIDNGQSWDAVIPAEVERLPALASNVVLRANFSGSVWSETPALKFGDVNLIGYLDQESGVYVTREHAVSRAVASAKIYVEMNIPSGTTVTWYAMNDGVSWELMTLEETNPVDHQWTEYTLRVDFSDSAGREVRFKAEFEGSSLTRAKIHRLGATFA